MKCLTVMQPWASLLVGGFKQHETRSWKPEYRGLVAIHAARKLDPVLVELCHQEPFRSALLRLGYKGPAELPRGYVIGIVELVDILSTNRIGPMDISEEERKFGDFRPGRYAWKMANPTRLPLPFVMSGRLGLFEINLPDSPASTAPLLEQAS